ncbi:MAG: M28 family metallopeptidase [Planctomycetota bacterium]|jgi:Zn-dependent M28 family amino/carboxypeptidase
MKSSPVAKAPFLLLSALCIAWQMAPAGGSHAADTRAAGSDDGSVHLADLSRLDAGEVDVLLALPAVEGWVEFGDVALLVGAAGLPQRVGARFPEVAFSSVAREGRDPWLVRLDGPTAVAASRDVFDTVPEGLRVLVGRGRHALVLASDEVAERLGTSGVELQPLPFGTAVVQRADRYPAPAAGMAASTPIVSAAVQAVDIDRYTDVVTDLVAFGTRYTHHAAFPDVTAYLEDAFADLGYAVSLDPFQIGGKTRHNVIAEIPGDVTPDDVYIVCGHYDSTSGTPGTFAPGADDNASGSAAVVEMARVLRQYRFASTIRFVCFAGEEQGLVGSSTYVSDLIAAGQLGDVKGVINMDMIGYLNTGAWDVLLEGKAGVSAGLLDLLPGMVTEHTSLTGYVSTNPYGSDHMPFINNGVNAVLTIEYEDWFNPNYHSTSDTVATLTLPFAIEIIKLNVAATASMAGISGGYMLEYGAGLAGSGGYVPVLSGGGSANLGQGFSVLLEDGLGGAPGYLVLGTDGASLPKFGGTILVGPLDSLTLLPAVLAGAATPGAGWVQFHSSVPNDPLLTGVGAYLQYVVADPGAVFGRSLSNGLEFVFGN